MKQHVRKVAVGAALVATTLTGGAIGASLIGTSSAQTTSTTTAPSSGAPAAPNSGTFDPSKGGHTANGITETLLTGSDADKAKAAALAAVPGGTIQRVETDAEGAAYEAHMLKSDGTPVTVKMDKDFKVTGVETGGPGGPGGPGGHGPRGQAPSSSTTPTSSST